MQHVKLEMSLPVAKGDMQGGVKRPLTLGGILDHSVFDFLGEVEPVAIVSEADGRALVSVFVLYPEPVVAVAKVQPSHTVGGLDKSLSSVSIDWRPVRLAKIQRRNVLYDMSVVPLLNCRCKRVMSPPFATWLSMECSNLF